MKKDPTLDLYCAIVESCDQNDQDQNVSIHSVKIKIIMVDQKKVEKESTYYNLKHILNH